MKNKEKKIRNRTKLFSTWCPYRIPKLRDNFKLAEKMKESIEKKKVYSNNFGI